MTGMKADILVIMRRNDMPELYWIAILTRVK